MRTLTCSCGNDFGCTKDNYVGHDTMCEEIDADMKAERGETRKDYFFLFNCPTCVSSRTLITHSCHF